MGVPSPPMIYPSNERKEVSVQDGSDWAFISIIVSGLAGILMFAIVIIMMVTGIFDNHSAVHHRPRFETTQDF